MCIKRYVLMVFGVCCVPAMADLLPLAIYNPLADEGETGVLWGVGRFDGQPVDELAALVGEQYAVRVAEGEVVPIRSVLEFPQVIRAGQSFVIHLGELPRANLRLRLAVTATFTAPNEFYADPVNRKLRILFNGQPVWHRWVVDGHASIETFVPPAYVESAANVLVIENEGEQAMAFDALRLERYVPGGPLLAALAGGHAQPGVVAVDLRQVVLQLDAPRGVPPAGPEAGPARAPVVLNDAFRAYRVLQEAPEPELDEQEAAETLARWDAEIAAALRRGLWPVVEVRAGAADEAAWRGYAARYGGLVQAWVLPSPQAAQWVRDTVDGARIYGMHWTAAAPDEPGEEPAFDGVFMGRRSALTDMRVDRLLGRNRAKLWADHREPLPAGLWLTTRPGFQDLVLQRRDARYTLEVMMAWWMAGGDLVVLEGGEPGGTLFPAVDGRPSPIWEGVRPLFGLADGRARRVSCVVVPTGRDRALWTTHWVAAENGDALVTLLLLPCRREQDREVQVIVPVPWQGPTVGVVDGVVPVFILCLLIGWLWYGIYRRKVERACG